MTSELKNTMRMIIKENGTISEERLIEQLEVIFYSEPVRFKEYIKQLLEDGEIYEKRPKVYGWLE